MSELRPGTVVAGRFRVDRRIGSGAMAFVYAATHLELRQSVALKFLNDVYRADPDASSRFVREARAQFSLKSEHVGRVFDVARRENGQPFIVMELLEGRTLKEIMEESPRLPVEDSVRLILQVCEGVGEAHALGIVHRDLKPGNIFVTTAADGGPLVKVLDFGLAKARDHASAGSLTAADMLIGTPRYMAPEQFAQASRAGAACDVWALGVVLYRMLTGELPFDGPHPLAIAQRIRSEAPVHPQTLVPTLPSDVVAVVLRCLAREPAARYKDASALGAALASLLPGATSAGAARRPRANQPERHVEEDDETAVASSPPVALAPGDTLSPRQGAPVQVVGTRPVGGSGDVRRGQSETLPASANAVTARYRPPDATSASGPAAAPPPPFDEQEMVTRKRPAFLAPPPFGRTTPLVRPGPTVPSGYAAAAPRAGSSVQATPSSSHVTVLPSNARPSSATAPPSQLDALRASVLSRGPGPVVALAVGVLGVLVIVLAMWPSPRPSSKVIAAPVVEAPAPPPTAHGARLVSAPLDDVTPPDADAGAGPVRAPSSR